MKRDDRIQLTIPYPSDIPRLRGIQSTSFDKIMWRVRATVVEQTLIDAAADQIGITRSQFIRWCAVMAARETMRFYDDTDIEYPDYCTPPSSSE